MRIFTTRHRVLRYRERNSFESYQVLVRERLVLGIVVSSVELDREDVPSWHAIAMCTLGYSEWKSRLFAQYAQLLQPSHAK